MIIKMLKNLKHSAYLKKIKKESIAQAQELRASQPFATIYSGLTSTFSFADHPEIRGIWAVAMVKNEEDIIRATVEHLLSQGIDAVLVADNGSTDKTLSILQELAQDHPVIVGHDAEPKYYQSEKMTWLSDYAAAHGAQWVIPFDADEFWFGHQEPLKDTLESTTADALYATLYNQFPPAPESDQWTVDTSPHPDGKVCFKPDGVRVLAMGNHQIIGLPFPTPGEVNILHRPWRSYEQFVRKVRQGAQSLDISDLPEDKGYHWRVLGHMNDSQLSAMWSDLLQGNPLPETVAWKPRGELRTLSSPHVRKWQELPLPPQSQE